MPESVNGCLAIGQWLYVNTPDNPLLHGIAAEVITLTDYGAVVKTGVGSGVFRALREELTYEPPVSLPADYPIDAYKGADTIVTSSRPSAREQGYTGDICHRCGEAKMTRNGSCLLCLSCNESSGCS